MYTLDDVMSEQIREMVKNAVVEASTTFKEDQIAAYEFAINKEENDNSRWVLELLLENAHLAKNNQVPLCDDTGIPHILVEVGPNTSMPEDFFDNLEMGVADGLRNLPGRSMAVLGDDIQRIEQNNGLSEILGR